jgi:dTDP-4-amino-4,6-dideoxygalactose transaminase
MGLSGTENVLVPAYHCGVEIEAVLMAGVQLRYYDVRDDFSIDLSELQNLIDSRTRAVLLIHYFGFPQTAETIKVICAAAGVMLVEDCSQALFSCFEGKPLGIFGDVAIFSQRKTLPLPDGGALLVNNPELKPEPPGNRASDFVAVKKALGMLFRSTFNLNPRNTLPYPFERLATLINRLITLNAGGRYSAGMEIDMDRCSLAMSRTSEKIMNRTRIDHVILRRRDNYIHLLGKLKEKDIPFADMVREDLPEGVCPLFFPVRISGTRRSSLQDRLLSFGVSTFVFGEELHPSLPRHQFPNAETLSQELLCFPVHQDLKSDDMSYIAETLLQTAKECHSAVPR